MKPLFFPKKARPSRRSVRLVRALVLLLLALLAYWGIEPSLVGPPAQPPAQNGAVRVIDGDTLDVGGRRVRLFGIDAPESKQFCSAGKTPYACGEAATEALRAMIGDSPVSCHERDVDRYGRLVAICHTREVELNDWLVRQGYAVAYRTYTDRYNEAEAEASAQKRGLWQGRFDYPWDYRRSVKRK